MRITLAIANSLLRICLWVLQQLPRKWLRAVGATFGRLLHVLDRKHRTLAASNLELAMGETLTAPERQTIVRKVFIHFGTVFFDLIHLAYLEKEKRQRLYTAEGQEHIQNALKTGKGALLFTAHFGLWEMAPSLINTLGKLHVVARPMDNQVIEQELTKIRNRLGSEVISKFRASRQILRCLRDNEIVAILIDQNVVENEAVFVDFFGKKAATTPSLATFHLRTEAPVIPVFVFPKPDGTFHIKIGPPISIPLSGTFDLDVLLLTQAYTSAIEEKIRTHPEFWFWFHNRWKTRPSSHAT